MVDNLSLPISAIFIGANFALTALGKTVESTFSRWVRLLMIFMPVSSSICAILASNWVFNSTFLAQISLLLLFVGYALILVLSIVSFKEKDRCDRESTDPEILLAQTIASYKDSADVE